MAEHDDAGECGGESGHEVERGGACAGECCPCGEEPARAGHDLAEWTAPRLKPPGEARCEGHREEDTADEEGFVVRAEGLHDRFTEPGRGAVDDGGSHGGEGIGTGDADTGDERTCAEGCHGGRESAGGSRRQKLPRVRVLAAEARRAEA